jgi:hypothetical protein
MICCSTKDLCPICAGLLQQSLPLDFESLLINQWIPTYRGLASFSISLSLPSAFLIRPYVYQLISSKNVHFKERLREKVIERIQTATRLTYDPNVSLFIMTKVSFSHSN